MSFVAPLWLIGAAVVAAGVVLAHLFSTSTPPEQVLPTARFVPQGTQMAVLRTTRLTDIALLLMRVLAVLLLGLALAGAHVPGSGPSRVVLVDASRAMDATRAVGTAIADDADAPEATDRIIAFDSVPRSVDASALDTLKPSRARGSLSAALVAAHQAIGDVSKGRSEIELVIVSPLVAEEVDSATARLVALWEGPVRFRRVAAAAAPALSTVDVRAVGDDPVAATITTLAKRAGSIGTRVVRDNATSADSAFARQGGVLVHWPVSPSSGSSASAVANARMTVVGLAKPGRVPGAGRIIARWSDGTPAASEAALGAGCVRDVAIPVDPVGDIALRDSFRGLVLSLLEPCGGARDFAPVADSAILPRPGTSRASIVPSTDSRLPLWLAILALVALGVEQLMRRRRRTE